MNIDQIRARFERAKENVKADPWYVSTNVYIADVGELLEDLEAKERELAEAVSDMKIMALAMRESEELSEGCCFACVCDAQNLPDDCILPYGECPGYEKDDCFEWRGAKEQTNGTP